MQWVDYIKANGKPLQSIDPLDTNYADLSFLQTCLQGRDIVELGESAHGVAEYSQAKIRIIKYLHEQLGYDVLAFESSILSTYLANEQAPQLTPTQFMQNSIFAVWSTTDVLELFSYIQSTEGTTHPLILAGFDVQLTTPYEWQARPGVFQQVVATVDPVYALQVHDMDQAFIQGYLASSSGNNSYILTNYTDLKAKYQALTSFLDANQAQIEAAFPTRPLFPLVVRQAAWGMSAYLDEMYYTAQGAPYSNLAPPDRDAGMAVNLELLIDQLYAGKKIMVWAHDAHVMHDGASYSELGWQNMGNWIHNKYGNRVYTLGLYMYQGTACWNGGGTCGGVYTSKYPPAKPVALQLLAPQRGLTATGESKSKNKSKNLRCYFHCRSTGRSRESKLPELSNFYCHPGRAGGSPFWISPAFPGSVEGLLHQANAPYIFLDIASAPLATSQTSWMDMDSTIRDWGVYDGEMVVRSEYDGLLQIDTVNPPTYVPF